MNSPAKCHWQSSGKRPTLHTLLFAGMLAALLVLPSSLPAPIYGECENLDHALEQSDMVAVVRILENPDQRRRREQRENPQEYTETMGGVNFGMYDDFGVYVLKTLEGDLPEGEELNLSLRFIHRFPPSDDIYRPTIWVGYDDPPTTQVLHLAFLTREPAQNPYRPQWEPAQGFSLNCPDSVLALHPDIDLSVADEGTLRERVVSLLEESLRCSRGTAWEKGARGYMEWIDAHRGPEYIPQNAFPASP